MTTRTRIERLANRSSALMEQQGSVFHRFLARIQNLSKQCKAVTFDDLTNELETVVKSEEQLAKGGSAK